MYSRACETRRQRGSLTAANRFLFYTVQLRNGTVILSQSNKEVKEEVRATWRKYQRHGVRTCATAMMLGFVWLVLGSFREQGRRESKRSYKKEACLDSHTYTPGMILKIKDFGSGAEQHGSHGDAVQKLYGLIGSGEGVKQGKEKGEERREEEGEKRTNEGERVRDISFMH